MWFSKTSQEGAKTQRKPFTFYRTFFENIETLPTNKEKLQAFMLICDFALNGNEPDLSDKKPCACAVFRAVRPVLETAHRRDAKFATVCKSLPTPKTHCPIKNKIKNKYKYKNKKKIK